MFPERLVKLMDYNEGSFQDFLGHCNVVSNVKFAPSGELLCSTSHAEILMWNVKAWQDPHPTYWSTCGMVSNRKWPTLTIHVPSGQAGWQFGLAKSWSPSHSHIQALCRKKKDDLNHHSGKFPDISELVLQKRVLIIMSSLPSSSSLISGK